MYVHIYHISTPMQRGVCHFVRMSMFVCVMREQLKGIKLHSLSIHTEELRLDLYIYMHLD